MQLCGFYDNNGIDLKANIWKTTRERRSFPDEHRSFAVARAAAGCIRSSARNEVCSKLLRAVLHDVLRALSAGLPAATARMGTWPSASLSAAPDLSGAEFMTRAGGGAEWRVARTSLFSAGCRERAAGTARRPRRAAILRSCPRSRRQCGRRRDRARRCARPAWRAAALASPTASPLAAAQRGAAAQDAR
eukprot:6210494-Pleurochrysis_carterae.AAC.1